MRAAIAPDVVETVIEDATREELVGDRRALRPRGPAGFSWVADSCCVGYSLGYGFKPFDRRLRCAARLAAHVHCLTPLALTDAR
ncbi:MAG: hypothetical protein ABI877_03985 [Gemmatimonadaceae bacterium]